LQCKLIMKKDPIVVSETCKASLTGIKDIQDVMSGKWKYLIIASLYFIGKMKFMELHRQVEGIAPKVLSKELKDLEDNHIITRRVCDTKPITVEYSLTDIGESLHTIILEMGKCGIEYRLRILSEFS
jgi:DNA-binding HxlR family transcriptional regulator